MVNTQNRSGVSNQGLEFSTEMITPPYSKILISKHKMQKTCKDDQFMIRCIISYLKNEGASWVNNANPDDDVTFVVIKVK